jgi:hypothetical protein
MTRLNFPCGEMDSRRYSVVKKYFAIVRSGAGVHGFIVRSTMKSLVKIHAQLYGM